MKYSDIKKDLEKKEIKKENPKATPKEIDDLLLERTQKLAEIYNLQGANYLVRMKTLFNTSDKFLEEQLRRIKLVCQLLEKHPVLIQGPSGTGKELMARVAHEITDMRKPFLAVNCASIPSELFESHMFGHVQGAFTGAVRLQEGAVHHAEDGTLFLDEIGELALHHQAKILRLLQEKKYNKVGNFEEMPANCRFIFATHRDLKKMVYQGTFREDLYYRICTFVVYTTPLHKRAGDADFIAKQKAKEMGYEDFEKLPQAIIDSPGNVRAIETYLLRKKVWLLDDEDACAGLDAITKPE